MGLTIKTLKCDGGCRSCYEEKIRDNCLPEYDINKIFDSIGESENKFFTIHGGEPLLLKIKDIKKLLKFSFEKTKRSGIQTGGHLITDKHIELFKKYNTHVGISLDGNTPELNKGRWNKKGSEDICKKMTYATIKNMYKLKEAGVKMSIISVLRKYNADNNNIEFFIDFLFWLDIEFDIKDVRTNPGIVYENKFKDEEELNDIELGYALIRIYKYCIIYKDRKIQPPRDVIELMMGHNSSSCNFGKCDPWNTAAETTINELGEIGNCLKSGGGTDGIQTLKSGDSSEVRYIILKQIPKEFGGCKDCKYWFICLGGCPGAGIDNDWRNRTRFCGGWKIFFDYVYNDIKGLFPNIFLQPDFYPQRVNKNQVFESLSSTWREGEKIDIKKIKESKKEKCSNIEHGDIPHGDSHGDHTDRSKS